MPRLPLIHIPNGIYAVVSKCNNNEFLFDSPHKFDLYIRHLIECKKIFGFRMYDIGCMSNHVHELYRIPTDVAISQILQRVKGEFSRKFNKKFGRSGHFWRNKPFYRIIENERYAFNNMNYFHWNPVKAGLVKRPEDWPYSGYRFHILRERSGLLGELLDPLPGEEELKLDGNMLRHIEKVYQSRESRYIGSQEFCKKMRLKFSGIA
ncbi:MAG: transposase [Deltaproteobacteria bacterium]|nr:transposase [Deltaproteobacteria bacterium]